MTDIDTAIRTTLAERARAAVAQFVSAEAGPMLEAYKARVLELASKGQRKLEDYPFQLNYQASEVRQHIVRSLQEEGLTVEVKYFKKLEWNEETKATVELDEDDPERIQLITICW
jgi:hypothetical protein